MFVIFENMTFVNYLQCNFITLLLKVFPYQIYDCIPQITNPSHAHTLVFPNYADHDSHRVQGKEQK